MSALFIVRAQVDPSVRDAFDRAWGDKVKRTREIVDTAQAI